MSDFKITLDFGFYDTMMLAQMIAHARRYGDNQVSDFAGELRERMEKAAGGERINSKPTLLELQAVEEPILTSDATAVIAKVNEPTTEMPAVAPKPTALPKKK